MKQLPIHTYTIYNILLFCNLFSMSKVRKFNLHRVIYIVILYISIRNDTGIKIEIKQHDRSMIAPIHLLINYYIILYNN